MKKGKEKESSRISCFYIIATAVLTGLVFLAHRKVPFMMDDEWYSTNLATNEPLHGFMDIVEGQIWHFYHWGGRCITHGILQLTLMSGELTADVLNTLMTLLLSLMICVVADRKSTGSFLTAFTLLYTLNANARMSMFWQAGTVNYVYSAVWILLFIWPYLEEWRGGTREFPLITFWIIPIGLMTGWSNENMGPVSFLLALATIVYCRKQNRRLKSWMILGAVNAFVGSVLVVAAPGNFVRSASIKKTGVAKMLWERFFSMLRAGTDFLFPVCLLLVLLILISCVCRKKRVEKYQIVLLGFMILSFGAMVLSPHYPDRAAFGTMVIGIVLILTFLYDENMVPMPGKRYGCLLVACFWADAVIRLIREFVLV